MAVLRDEWGRSSTAAAAAAAANAAAAAAFLAFSTIVKKTFNVVFPLCGGAIVNTSKGDFKLAIICLLWNSAFNAA